MTFEEALKAMREGEFVIFDGRDFPLCMIGGRICELCYHGFSHLDSMNTCNIMRSDWKIWTEETIKNKNRK